MRTPAQYGGSVWQFILVEYAGAEKLNIVPDVSTGFIRALIDRRYNSAVGGLFGCTSVIIASHQAVWVSYFGGVPSFRRTGEAGAVAWRYGKAATVEDFAYFNRDLINRILNGDGTNIPGLLQFTTAGGQFHSTQNPV